MKRSIMGLIYFIQGMRSAGINIDERLQKIGINVEQLDPQALIHRRLEWKIQQYISEEYDVLVGIEIGKQYSLSGYGSFLMLLLTAKDVQSALEQAILFQMLTYLFAELDRQIDQQNFILIYRPVQGYEQDLRTHAEVAGTYKFIQDIYKILGLPQLSIQVNLSFHPPVNEQQLAQYQHYYGRNVSFGHRETTFLCDSILLKQPLSTADTVMHDVYKKRCLEDIAKLQVEDIHHNNLIVQLKDYLQLQTGKIPHLKDISLALNLPERTLRHQLALQQTSFQKIKDEILKQRTIVLLSDQKMTIEQIADVLGYAETAAFNHAFKRWFGGISPKQYQKRM